MDHVALMREPVVYALVIAALTHEGGADVSRIPVSVCRQEVTLGVGPVKSALRSLTNCAWRKAIERFVPSATCLP